jgi:hypothetical protein
MRDGCILVEGPPPELRAQLDGRILEVRGPSLHELRKTAATLDGVEDVRLFGDKLHLRVQPGMAESVMVALTGAGSPLEARPIPPTLEDVFLTLSQGNGNSL